MALQFPNRSCSYDARRNQMRFWGHDGALEISFFVEAGVFFQSAPSTALSETEILDAFDQHRERICKVAERIYKRHDKATYVLTVADCLKVDG
jgi:hypothetical protein